MTEEELKKVKFRFVCHLNMEDENSSTYESEDGKLGFCDHVPKRPNGTFRKGYRHYRIEGKIYKKYDKFIEALKDYSPKGKEDEKDNV